MQNAETWLNKALDESYAQGIQQFAAKPTDSKLIAAGKCYARADVWKETTESRLEMTIGIGAVNELIHHPVKLAGEVVAGAAIAYGAAWAGIPATALAIGTLVIGGTYVAYKGLSNAHQVAEEKNISTASAIPIALKESYRSAKDAALTTAMSVAAPEKQTLSQRAVGIEHLHGVGAAGADFTAAFAGGLSSGLIKKTAGMAVSATDGLLTRTKIGLDDWAERASTGGFKWAYQYEYDLAARAAKVEAYFASRIPIETRLAGGPGIGLFMNRPTTENFDMSTDSLPTAPNVQNPEVQQRIQVPQAVPGVLTKVDVDSMAQEQFAAIQRSLPKKNRGLSGLIVVSKDRTAYWNGFQFERFGTENRGVPYIYRTLRGLRQAAVREEGDVVLWTHPETYWGDSPGLTPRGTAMPGGMSRK